MARRDGFTLLEVLVAVGLIAILAGLLLPGIGRARRHATDAACRNNLRQIGQLFALYQVDAPRSYAPGASYADMGGGSWHRILRDRYAFSRNSLICPQGDELDNLFVQSSYMVAFDFAQVHRNPRWKFYGIKPSDVVLLGENRPLTNLTSGPIRLEDVESFIGWHRHGRLMTNILWLDQHVTGVDGDVNHVVNGWVPSAPR